MKKLAALSLIALMGFAVPSAFAQSADAPPPAPPHEGPFGGPGGPRGPMARFAEMDANKDGFLTKEEMYDSQKKNIDRMFDKNDTDKDGKLSQAELEAGFQKIREKMRKQFEEMKAKGQLPEPPKE